MSSTYTTASGTVSFTASADSWQEPANSQVDVLGFPGGDAIAISISGQRETRRTFKAMFDTPALYRAFRDMRAKAGSLFVETWDTSAVNAVLVRTAPDPPWMSGQVTATVEFILY